MTDRKTAKQIVKDYLIENGYDGLCGDECSCEIDDLMACGEFGSDCVPGWNAVCKGCEEFGDKCIVADPEKKCWKETNND